VASATFAASSLRVSARSGASLIDQLGQILGGGVEFSRERGFGRLGLAMEAFALRRARRRPDDEFPGGRDGRPRLDLDRGRDRGLLLRLNRGHGRRRVLGRRERRLGRVLLDPVAFVLGVAFAAHFASVGEGRGFGVHLVGPLRRRFRVAIGGHLRSCSSSSSVKARPVATRAGV